MVEQPSTETQNWFDVTIENFVMANGVTAVNVEGNYLWLRVVIPTNAPVTYPGIQPYPRPMGNVTQIIYSY